MRERIASVKRRLDLDGQLRAEAHLHLVEALAWKQFRLCGRTVPLDELIGEARFALIYGASLFDPTKGVPFGAYVTLVIRHRLTQVVTLWRRGGRLDQVHFTDLAYVDSADGPPCHDPICSRTREPSWVAAIREQVDLVRRTLPKRWFRVVYLHYSEGYTLEEVGDRLEISRERVRQLLAKALDRVRSLLSETDFEGKSSSVRGDEPERSAERHVHRDERKSCRTGKAARLELLLPRRPDPQAVHHA